MHVRAITPSKMNAAKIRISPGRYKKNWHGNKYFPTDSNLYSINKRGFLTILLNFANLIKKILTKLTYIAAYVQSRSIIFIFLFSL